MKFRKYLNWPFMSFLILVFLIVACDSSKRIVNPQKDQPTNLPKPLVFDQEKVKPGDIEKAEIDNPEITEPIDSLRPPALARGNCSWWNSLGQANRNYRIVLEALYSVDRDIWGQNRRIPCSWSSYLRGGCALMGNWNYSHRSNIPGWGGWCKDFAKEILERASGGAATLPGGTYDYRAWYPYRNRSDGTRYAQAGEIMQFSGYKFHTAVIISNLGGGWFEIVDSNWSWPYDYKIRKHVINVNSGAWRYADLKFYVIDCY